MRKKLIIGGCGVSLVVGLSISLSIHSSTKAGADTGVTPANAIEATVEQAENSVLATLTPLATVPTQSNACMATGCNLAQVSLSSPRGAASVFTDNKALAAGSSEAGIMAMADSPKVLARYAVARTNTRNDTVLSSVFDPVLASNFAQTANNIVSSENKWLGGNNQACATSDCTIIGASGAEVTGFSNENIRPTTATVTATVTGWQDDAQITPTMTEPLNWHRVQSTLVVNETLTLQPDGTWRITGRQGSFAPGSEP